ncbi:hypothetical protein O0I10_006742 [Lichtheimia ornata]|uniref:Uncharacterized protein n=1 Tax=Lichtheimia ornata TaxID=688661 RepID=A0AAD7XWV0_9FUNG|nr:uncharacterized protein O0I10_006742 [Lichtheimia ornata]KAJ8657440.1 hypothetical protein O0I10_006742 [Lichtheimia ornata]
MNTRWQLQYEKLWSRKLQDPINCLAVGKPFLEELIEENDILIGSTAGRILILNQSKPPEVLMETKGGSIQAMHLYDLTGLRAQDLVVGDSNGVVTMFSRQRFLSKLDIGSPATHICIHEMEAQGYEIIAGSMNGQVTSFHPRELFWTLDIGRESKTTATLGMNRYRAVGIHCILSAILNDRFNNPQRTLLVCDGWPFVHFIQDGKRIQSIRVPTVIQSMATGRFLSASSARRFRVSSETSRPKYHADTDIVIDTNQVLLGGQDGSVYIMVDGEIHPWFKVGFGLSKIMTFRPTCLPDNEPDLVACVGLANCIRIYSHGELISEIKTSDWPQDITVGDVNADGQDELVVGLFNNIVEIYAWKLIQ